MRSSSKYSIALALLAAVLFGAATPASKALLGALTPFQLAGTLYLGAALGVAPFCLRQGGKLALPSGSNRITLFRLLGAILCGGILGPVLLLSGLHLAAAASVSLWLNLELAATAVLGACLFRDHLGWLGWSGVALALLASAVVSWGEGAAGASSGVLILLACICWGFDNHLTALIDGMTPAQSTFWKGLVAGSVNLAIGISLAPMDAHWWVLGVALGVGAISYGASIALYITSSQGLGATRAQVIFSSAPFFGIALSLVLLGEVLSSSYLAASVLFIIAVGLLAAERHGHRHRHVALVHTHSHRHDDMHHSHRHPGLPLWTRHSHGHDHTEVSHSHSHWPDLHHRHEHEREKA